MNRFGRACACATALVSMTLGGAKPAEAQGRVPAGWLAIRSAVPAGAPTVSVPRWVTFAQPDLGTGRPVSALAEHLTARLDMDRPGVLETLSGRTAPLYVARTTPLERFGGHRALERLSPELKEASHRYQIGVRVAF